MEYQTINNELLPAIAPVQQDHEEHVDQVHKAFIKGNTVGASYNEIKQYHTIPVFVKDNEPTISHTDFIDAVYDAASMVYGNESVTEPSIRLSHAIKGRIPEAKNKPACDLYEHEKTLYFERMMFVMDVPCYYDEVAGNHLSLTVGGVKAYNLDNLYNKKGADEHFKVFVGFKNAVCTNLCVSTDGLSADIKVKDPRQLRDEVYNLISKYNAVEHLGAMRKLSNYHLSDRQFAQFVGRCRMYQFLTSKEKQGISPLLFGDQQINSVCKDYYRDKTFSKEDDGSISLWNVYNLFTGACKSTYIDQYLPRSVNAFDQVQDLRASLDGKFSWFLQ